MTTRVKQVLDTCITDKNGKVVIGQFPNVPLLGWLLFLVAGIIVSDAVLKSGFASLSNAFLFVWAYLEIIEGATYFRQLLGILVFSVAIIGYFV